MGDYKHVGRRLAQSTRANIISESKATVGVRDRADIRGHDRRRTAASLMASGGVPRFVISRILNHSEEKDVTSVYDRYGYDSEKKAAELLESAARCDSAGAVRITHRSICGALVVPSLRAHRSLRLDRMVFWADAKHEDASTARAHRRIAHGECCVSLSGWSHPDSDVQEG
jgi:hypothetical protein